MFWIHHVREVVKGLKSFISTDFEVSLVWFPVFALDDIQPYLNNLYLTINSTIIYN